MGSALCSHWRFNSIVSDRPTPWGGTKLTVRCATCSALSEQPYAAWIRTEVRRFVPAPSFVRSAGEKAIVHLRTLFFVLSAFGLTACQQGPLMKSPPLDVEMMVSDNAKRRCVIREAPRPMRRVLTVKQPKADDVKMIEARTQNPNTVIRARTFPGLRAKAAYTRHRTLCNAQNSEE